MHMVCRYGDKGGGMMCIKCRVNKEELRCMRNETKANKPKGRSTHYVALTHLDIQAASDESTMTSPTSSIDLFLLLHT